MPLPCNREPALPSPYCSQCPRPGFSSQAYISGPLATHPGLLSTFVFIKGGLPFSPAPRVCGVGASTLCVRPARTLVVLYWELLPILSSVVLGPHRPHRKGRFGMSPSGSPAAWRPSGTPSSKDSSDTCFVPRPAAPQRGGSPEPATDHGVRLYSHLSLERQRGPHHSALGRRGGPSGLKPGLHSLTQSSVGSVSNLLSKWEN